jgi:hypothetical protein
MKDFLKLANTGDDGHQGALLLKLNIEIKARVEWKKGKKKNKRGGKIGKVAKGDQKVLPRIVMDG